MGILLQSMWLESKIMFSNQPQDMRDTLVDAININAVIALINQKYAETHDNKDKAEVLTEVLNEVKLYLMPSSQEVH
jgi:hypothetical protein